MDVSTSASSSDLPMMVIALFTLDREVTLATLMTFSQYSMLLRMSLAYLNWTRSFGTPRAMKQSSMYLAQVRMFSRSPPSLSLMYACQSAQKMVTLNPASQRSLIFCATSTHPRWTSPEGSNPI